MRHRFSSFPPSADTRGRDLPHIASLMRATTITYAAQRSLALTAMDNPPANTARSRHRHIGRPMPRLEDLRLVRGEGRYTDDEALPGQVFAVFVRSPHAHARIIAINIAAARSLPGVLAVLTGEDYVADGHIGMSHFPNPADALDVRVASFPTSSQNRILDELQLPLAVERARFVGEAVAMVVADTLPAAR